MEFRRNRIENVRSVALECDEDFWMYEMLMALFAFRRLCACSFAHSTMSVCLSILFA